MNNLNVVAGLTVLAAVLCSASPAVAQQAASSGATTSATPPAATSNSAGRRAVRDPQTGEFIDGPGEAAAAPQARSQRPQSAAPAVTRPEEMNELMLQFMQRTRTQPVPGTTTRSISLTPRHLSSSMATRQADGSIATECVQGESEAEHRLHAQRVEPRVDSRVNIKALRETRDVQ